MIDGKPTKSTPYPPSVEGPRRRQERRQFFHGWIAASVIGFIVVLAAAFYATAVGHIEGVAAIATMTLMAILLFSGTIWLVRYIAVGNQRHGTERVRQRHDRY